MIRDRERSPSKALDRDSSESFGPILIGGQVRLEHSRYSSMMNFAVAVISGFLFWGLIEYITHGFLSPRWKTFASPLHWSHHKQPRRVFTFPIAIVSLTLGHP